ncbi:MAG: hypothetical protein JOZ09_02915 [Pseudonocardiales bacterium]|jgi:hypothetical protein|nr:hypothetical protein [Pseudonocardiales bacterium]
MSIKVHIAAALVTATSALVILSLLVYAQSVREQAQSLSSDRQVRTFLKVDPHVTGVGSTATMPTAVTAASNAPIETLI